MSINKIGSMPDPAMNYITRNTKKVPTASNFVLPDSAVQSHNVQKSQMAGGTFVLHYFDNDEGDKSISAACGRDYSITVYEPQDYDSENPVYKVKLWDKDGNVTERMVDVTKVEPRNCDYIDMYAYSAYLSQSGSCPNALSSFMGVDAGDYGLEGRTYEDLYTVKDWVKAAKDMMHMQYDAGNLPGYLEYKQFFDFLVEKERNTETDNETIKSEKLRSQEEESESRTEVVVKPDGSKVMLVTVQAGGIQMTTSVELSKPDKMQNRGLQDGSIINDSIRNIKNDSVENFKSEL